MTKRKKHPATPKDLRRLARSQIAVSAATLLDATAVLAKALGFESVSLISESPIAATRVDAGDVLIDFLYGPSEFRVELVLSHRHYPGRRLGLPELVQYSPIRAWMEARAANLRVTSQNPIETEMCYFTEFLQGPCAEAFAAPSSFFNRFSSGGSA